MTNKIEVLDDERGAVRTTADRISREGRRARREFNGTNRHLALDPRVIEDLSKSGHLCWCNDDGKGHLANLESIGYRFVTIAEAYGEREGLDPNDRVKVRYGTCDEKGSPQDIYLMLQPWEFYNEDMEQLAEASNMVDDNIRQEGKDIERGYGHSVKYKS